MPSPPVWPLEKIHDLLVAAVQDGEAEAKADDSDAARRLRYAIYNYRKRAKIGLDLILTVEGSSVMLRRVEAKNDFAISRPYGD